MLLNRDSKKFYVYSKSVDMRKSFNGLLGIINSELQEDALNGNAYIFISRSKKLSKILWWDRTGWCIMAKKLERGTFEINRAEDSQSITEKELLLLLDGVFKKRKIFQ